MAININRDRNTSRQRTRTVFVPVNIGGGGGTQEKIKMGELGIKLADSTFTEVPDIFDFSDVTDMSYMFSYCGNLQTISSLDTSKATDMLRMFTYCSNLQTIPQLDTSQVTSMNLMFNGCSSLKTIPQLDTTNVRNMSQMFKDCQGLDENLHLELNTPNLTDVTSLFARTPVRNVTDAITILNNSSLTDMTEIQALWNEHTWDFSNVTSTRMMFYECPNISSAFFHNLKTSLDISYLTESTTTTEITPYQMLVSSLYFAVYDYASSGETPSSEQGIVKISESLKTHLENVNIDAFGNQFNQLVAMMTSKGWTLTV